MATARRTPAAFEEIQRQEMSRLFGLFTRARLSLIPALVVLFAWTWWVDPTGWRIDRFSTLHLPEEREKIRFVNRDGKLCNQLHRAVPDVAADAVNQLYPSNGHKPHVISHAAGRDVLATIRTRLPEQPLAESASVLRDCGNMSSPSVLFALERALSGNGSTPDDLWLVSFGAGFSCHGCSVVRK